MKGKQQVTRPRGRPPGSKNKDTLLQEDIKNDFTRLAKRRSKKIFEKLTELAMEGDPQMIKLFMDKIVPNAQIEGEQIKTDLGINIVISDIKSVQIEEKGVLEGEFEEIKENTK